MLFASIEVCARDGHTPEHYLGGGTAEVVACRRGKGVRRTQSYDVEVETFVGKHGSYKTESTISGAGGNADVYRAMSKDGPVAIKVLRRAAKRTLSEPRARFVREIEALVAEVQA